VDGKKLLFENNDSLFQRLKSYQLSLASFPSLELTREIVAANMKSDEIHEDVHQFVRIQVRGLTKTEKSVD
jgi:hypothetical protein